MQFNKNDMNLQHRINLMVALGKYMQEDGPTWKNIILKANQHNPWFIPDFIQLASTNIITKFLNKEALDKWIAQYKLDDDLNAKNIGLVMAGNIPLVGFHDFLTVFISGHTQTIKLSTKDDILLTHLITKLYELDNETRNRVIIADMLKGCDAYIATGSNNSARYFEQYFSKYPHIIRKNKTSVAILTGNESINELASLADDIHLYFGLGCRNVTKIFVPENYNFIPLIRSFDKYLYFKDHHKYNNNYDYQLSIMLMNNIYYMTNGSTLLVENESFFSPISVLNYEYYKMGNIEASLQNLNDVQCLAGKGYITFGQSQIPELSSYADGIDTMQFLLTL